MKTYYSLFLSLLFCSLFSSEIFAQDTIPRTENKVDSLESQENRSDQEKFTYIDVQPEFPGGERARVEFLMDNITYPKLARDNGIQGTVYVNFIIEKDGQITNVVVRRGIGGGCDEEAIRVVKMMPNWSPGTQNGEPVRVSFNMPIKFSLESGRSLPKKSYRKSPGKIRKDKALF